MKKNQNTMQCPAKNQNQKETLQMNKNLINQSNLQNDDYFRTSNSSNHSQLEAAEEFAIEEDMMELQHETQDVQQFNTQNYYNRQHYVGNRVVPKDEGFYKKSEK